LASGATIRPELVAVLAALAEAISNKRRAEFFMEWHGESG
jgi:hypothetical protein